jgi:hypothetical protein
MNTKKNVPGRAFMFGFGSGKKKREKQAEAEAAAREEAQRFVLAARANMLATTTLAFARFDRGTAESFATHFKTPDAVLNFPDEVLEEPLAMTFLVMSAIIPDEIFHFNHENHDRLIKDLTQTLPDLAEQDPAMRASLYVDEAGRRAIFDTLPKLDQAGVEMTSQIVFDYIVIAKELLDPPQGASAIVEGRPPKPETIRLALDNVFDMIEQQTGSPAVRERLG